MFHVPQDFALGDFDNTAIAQMEKENEAGEAGPGKAAEDAAGLDDAEDKGEEANGVAHLVRLPTTTEAEPRQKPGKPLIEEL